MNNYTIELEKLINDKTIKWTPWVGADYEKHKVLILGESHYSNRETDTKQQADPNYHKDVWGKGNKSGIRFYENMSKIVQGNDKIQDLFAKVAQMNLIQRPMKSPKDRPNKKDFEDGINGLFKVIEILKPEKVIIFSMSSKKYFDNKINKDFKSKYFQKIGRSTPVKYIDSINNCEILLAVHPSVPGINTKNWHKFINEQFWGFE